MFEGPDVVRHVKIDRLRWVGHVVRMSKQNLTRRVLLERIFGQRKRGRPKARFLGGVESDLRVIGWSERMET